jgi:hypothetical protein
MLDEILNFVLFDILSDFVLTFNFTLNTGKPRELEIKSQRKLNSGEWQKIWIDYNEHHVRFMINTDYQMVDLLPEEEFGPFEGSMFIGGATEYIIILSYPLIPLSPIFIYKLQRLILVACLSI